MHSVPAADMPILPLPSFAISAEPRGWFAMLAEPP